MVFGSLEIATGLSFELRHLVFWITFISSNLTLGYGNTDFDKPSFARTALLGLTT